MNIKPIHTEQDNIAAIAEIERLWNVESDSPDEERLEVLAVLVSDFEDRHYMQDTHDYERRCRKYIIGIICAWGLIWWMLIIGDVFTPKLRLFTSGLLHQICFWRLAYLTRR